MSTTPEHLSFVEKANAAFSQAARKVVERARLTGTPVIVWQDDHAVEVPPEQMDVEAAVVITKPERTPTNE